MIPTIELLKLKTFDSNPQLKKDLVKEILNHQKQDQIIKGTYGKLNGKWKGCAVGCSVRSLAITKGETLKENYADHKRYETDLGIPESLARLEDFLFENMPDDKAKKWPAEFIKAVPVGVNLSMIAPKFIVGTLKEVVKLKKVKGDKVVVKAVLDVTKLWEQVIVGNSPKEAAWRAAESAARGAAWRAAESAARGAAWSAAWSAARSATAYKMSRWLLKLLRSAK